MDAAGKELVTVAGPIAGARLAGYAAAGPDLDGDGRRELVFVVEPATRGEADELDPSHFYRRNDPPKPYQLNGGSRRRHFGRRLRGAPRISLRPGPERQRPPV